MRWLKIGLMLLLGERKETLRLVTDMSDVVFQVMREALFILRVAHLRSAVHGAFALCRVAVLSAYMYICTNVYVCADGQLLPRHGSYELCDGLKACA